ncbi:MAG: FAD-dependent oxidoreductase [Kiritimatiellae bacterium]|nr:FAD-dependent oxidoreductase [Kiritimatiellia bacterium]
MGTFKILICGIAVFGAVVARADVSTAGREKRVDVYPQCFDAGGWSLDAQFMDTIGSPYLIAHGCGQRVLDAVARVKIPQTGEWRVWVRSRKWVDGAGSFMLSVAGKTLPRAFGTAQEAWAWEDGGLVKLEKGTAVIRLLDQDGFDGRCAGVVLTNDGSVPTGALSPASQPVDETVKADFVVVGGGMPGTCAAVAAARRGLKVALIQDRPMLGGNGSREIRVWSGGEARYPLVRELRGWFMNRDANHALSDAHRMRIVADEKKIDLHVLTRAFGVEKKPDGSIAAVKALDLTFNRVIRFEAPLFCDATGDGWVGYWAGADWRMGREAKAEYNEKTAPEKADGDTLGASLMWTSTRANRDVPFSAPWAEKWACGVEAVNGEWNWEYGIHRDMIAEGEQIRDRLLLAVYGAFSLAKRKPENSRRVLDFLPFLLGKRESRRLLGDWVLNENDFADRRTFEDAIASTSWSIDLHYDDAKKGIDFLTTCRGPNYGRNWIPYRCIYSRNVSNLFMVGRCFSCTHVGLGSPRVINTLAQLGVAAGEAAAMCRERGCLPRGIWKEGHVRDLQLRLGGDFPGHPDPAHASWRIVDDEMPGVTFKGKWAKVHRSNGEQYGDFAHVPAAGAGDAIYPLPVERPGRYTLMGLVPYEWNIAARNRTAFTLVSGDQTETFTVDQTIRCGEWRELGTFEMAPGATLTLHPEKSVGTVFADAFAVVPFKGE